MVHNSPWLFFSRKNERMRTHSYRIFYRHPCTGRKRACLHKTCQYHFKIPLFIRWASSETRSFV